MIATAAGPTQVEQGDLEVPPRVGLSSRRTRAPRASMRDVDDADILAEIDLVQSRNFRGVCEIA